MALRSCKNRFIITRSANPVSSSSRASISCAARREREHQCARISFRTREVDHAEHVSGAWVDDGSSRGRQGSQRFGKVLTPSHECGLAFRDRSSDPVRADGGFGVNEARCEIDAVQLHPKRPVGYPPVEDVASTIGEHEPDAVDAKSSTSDSSTGRDAAHEQTVVIAVVGIGRRESFRDRPEVTDRRHEAQMSPRTGFGDSPSRSSASRAARNTSGPELWVSIPCLLTGHGGVKHPAVDVATSRLAGIERTGKPKRRATSRPNAWIGKRRQGQHQYVESLDTQGSSDCGHDVLLERNEEHRSAVIDERCGLSRDRMVLRGIVENNQ